MTVTNVLLRATLAIALVAPLFAVTDEERAACYPASRTYQHGGLRITIAQVARPDSPEPFYNAGKVRASITISRGKKILRVMRYDEAELFAYGHISGLFVPRSQPGKRYFSVVKYGDYNCRHLLIDRNGTVISLPGGLFFATMIESREILFTLHVQDSQGALTIFDLETGRKRASRRLPLEVISAFAHDNLIFFSGIGPKKECWLRIDGNGHCLIETPSLPTERMTELQIVDGFRGLGQ